MASSSVSTSRRGKLSLKRKRNVQNCREDEDVVATSSLAKRRSDAGGRETDRFSAGQSAHKKCASSLTLKAAVPRHDSSSTTPSSPSVCKQASLGSSLDQSALPDLPAWYGLKKEVEKLQVTETEVIKVGDVSVEWRPLPAYCRMCLVRRKQKRAAEGQGHLRTFAEASNQIKREGSARNVQNNPDQLPLGDNKSEPCHRSTDPRMGAVPDNFNDEFSGEKSTRTAISESQHLPKPQLSHPIKNEGILNNQNVSVRLQNGGSCGSNSKQGTTSLVNRKLQSLQRKTQSLSAASKPGHEEKELISRICEKLNLPPVESENGLPRTAQTESDVHTKPEPRQASSSKIRTFSKNDKHSSPSTQGIGLRGPSKVIPIKSDERVATTAKIKSTPPLTVSGKKVPTASKPDCTSGPLVMPVASNQHSVSPIDLSKKSLMPMQTNFASALPTRRPQEDPDSCEVIVLDSEDEEETTPSSSSTGFKRKLSGCSSDTSKSLCKKPRLNKVSHTDASGSLATRLKSRPKSPALGHSDGQFKPGPSKPFQTRLDSMLIRTSSADAKVQPSTPSSNLQNSSLGKPFTAYPSSSEPSKQAFSRTHANKQGSLQTKHSSASTSNSSTKKTVWNMSANVKPLFKKQRSEQPNSVQLQNAEQVPAKIQANSFTHTSSKPNNEGQKKLNFANAKGIDSRKSFESVSHKKTASTSSNSPHGKVTGFAYPFTTSPGQNPSSKQPRNQSVFGSNKVPGPLREPRKTSSLSSPQNANTRFYSEFQTAGDIRTDRETYPKQDTQPHTLGAHPIAQSLPGTSCPNRESNSRNKPQSINQGIMSNTNQRTNQVTLDCAGIQSCPLCGLQFPKRLPPEDRDRHIALCLSVSSDDAVW